VEVEQLISEGPDAMRPVLTALLNEAMIIECEQFLGASHYQHSKDRLGFVNGYQNKRIDTQAGTLNLCIPKCDLNRRMQHLNSIDLEKDVKNKISIED
jgi:transposase-like protein